MAFVKHVGKHGDRKVAIVFRKVPGEEHMALVLYTETIPSMIHDAVIQIIDSGAGQDVDNLAEALDRGLTADGRNLLQVIHAEGFLKKVNTNQIIVTPNAKSTVRLDELNRVIDDLKTGGEAADKLRQLDESAGLQDPSARKQAESIGKAAADASVVVDPMSDEGIAQTMIDQANQMAAEAKGLAAESERMLKEAYEMAPSLNPNAKKSKKSTTKKVTVGGSNLASMSKSELLAHAKANGIPSNASMNKAAILEAITSKQ